jgi:predicted nucleic acid-binding protein
MIVLDTNVISDLMAPKPSESVVGWVASIEPSWMFTTTIIQAEILCGIYLLPDGKRRAGLHTAAQKIFSEKLADRVLSFDPDAAQIYPRLVAKRRQSGRPISQFDAQIAAICLARGSSVATRNVTDFSDLGLDIVNPWNFRS